MQYFHSKYKVPNGKLIVVDVFVVDSYIYNIQISGDFFLEPDSALELINNSLKGLSTHISKDEIIKNIENKIPDNTNFFGFSPESIAVAILKALYNE